MKKIILSFLAAALFATSCKKDFFDINNNPNSPTEASITPDLLLSRALHSTATQVGTGYRYTADWIGYWAHSGDFGQDVGPETYAATTSFESVQWSTWYNILADVDLMEKKAKTSNLPFYEGAAKTLKTIGFMYLVDQYNNVPYSQAFDFTNHITPGYDKGEDIYANLFVQLEAASKIFASITTLDGNAVSSDIMFHGDLDLWRKLVNTMRLKLLIHESQVVSAATVNSVVAQINADGEGFLGAGETASVNPGYVEVSGKENPFYAAYKVSALGSRDNTVRANNYVLFKYFGPDGLPYTADDDIRYQYVFSKVDVKLAAFPGPEYDYRGSNYGEILPNTDPFKAPNQSDVAGPGLAQSITQDQPVLTSVESLFLQAEAAQRGWIAGNAQILFTNAIRESYTYLGITNAVAAADNYIANGGAISDYTAAADKVRLIAMQKYLALIGVANFEAYVDYRRLGIPADLPLSLNTGRQPGMVIPLRLQYPQSEFSYNTANVNAQGTINPQTSAIFWDR